MDTNTAAKFISSLTKSLQSLIHGCLDFESDIELGGYIYLRVDNAQKVDYVLNEKMQKNAVNSLTFFSNSFHAVPLGVPPETKSYSDTTSGLKDQTQSPSHDNFLGLHKQKDLGVPRQSQSTSSAKIKHFKSSEIHDNHMNTDSNIHLSGNSKLTDVSSKRDGRQDLVSNTQANIHTSSTEAQSQPLADFQTAFHSSGNVAMKLNQNQDCKSNQSRASSLHQQHNQKTGLLPESGEMEVVYIKAEEEDEVFSIPLHPPGSEAADNLTVRGKPPWLSMGFRQPYFFPYTRLARSQSWDRGMAQHPLRPPHSSEESSLTCKICGKSYRSRQGLIFHERVKHQNVYNVHCPVCGKGFQQTTHMYGHMATHTNVKNFQCPTCGTKYAHKTSLQQHLRSSHACQLMATSHQDKDLPGQSQTAECLISSNNQTQTAPQAICKPQSHGQAQNVPGNSDSLIGHKGADKGPAETVSASDIQQPQVQQQDKEDEGETSVSPLCADSSE